MSLNKLNSTVTNSELTIFPLFPFFVRFYITSKDIHSQPPPEEIRIEKIRDFT